LTANEEKKRRAAYCIDYDVACSMVEQLEGNVYQCRSFTENILFYEMDTKEGFLKNYSCLFLLVLLPLLLSKNALVPHMIIKTFSAVSY
jgi:hypothetical protein